MPRTHSKVSIAKAELVGTAPPPRFQSCAYKIGEMAQAVEFCVHKHEDPNSDSQHTVSQACGDMSLIPLLERQKQVDPWELLAVRSS